MQDFGDGRLPDERVVEPTLPIDGPSRFFRLDRGFSDRAMDRVEWVNAPNATWNLGLGHGFDILTEQPYFLQNKPRPRKPPQMWNHNFHYLVSPEVLDVLCRFDASALEFCPIDWEFNDGSHLEGYGLLDIVKLVYGYDYARSRVVVRFRQGKKMVDRFQLQVIRSDLPQEVHIFREARHRNYIYVSRELAEALSPFLAVDLHLIDPPTNRQGEFGKRKRKFNGVAPSPALVYELPQSSKKGADDLATRLSRQIPRLLDAGQIAAAEAKLTEWMQALPESPFHVALAPDVKVTTPPGEVAAALDAFVATARKETKPTALYAELNGFTINPDLWFFDFYAFCLDADEREGSDWLGDFYAASDEHIALTGMERLQAVYADKDMGSYRSAHPDAALLAEALVIVRFQRLLQEALASSKTKLPFYASAHDQYDLLTCVRRVPSAGG
jgi:hypothetical protein